MRAVRVFVAGFLLVGLGASCSSDDEGAGVGPSTICAPGKQEACPCLGAGQGVQRCNAKGTGFDACECPDGATTGGTGGSGPVDSGSDVADAGVGDAGEEADAPSLVCASPGACVLSVSIPPSTATLTTPLFDLDYTLCPSGADATTDPPVCIVEVDLGQSALTFTASEAGSSATGTIPMRARKLELQTDIDDGYVTLLDSKACPPATIGFVNPGVSLDLSAWPPSSQLGCTEVLGSNVNVDEYPLWNGMQLCDANLAVKTQLFAAIAAEVATHVETAITEAIANRACLVPR